MATGYDFQDVGDEHELVPQWMRDWQACLFDSGWMIPGYPPELGGRNCTPVQTLIYLETLASRRLLRSSHFPGYAIVAPSLLEYGNDEQKQLVPAAIRGDTIWCIGMSEPNAGSDLAGLQTRAELRDDHFVVNGQKVWTSYAMIAQKCFCYVRTDPTLPKHKGISLLIIDVDSPGIDIRPLRHINGTAGFAEVFFTDVIVPRENLVGGLERRLGHHAGLARARARGSVGGGRRPASSRPSKGSSQLAKQQGRAQDPIIRRKIAAAYELAASLARARLQGLRVVRAGIERAGAQLHEDGDVGSEQSRLRARHGDLRAARAGDRSRARREHEPVRRTGSSCRSPTRSRAEAPRSNATSSPSACWACRGTEARAVDFSLTPDQQLLRDTGRKLLERECPPALVRAHIDDPSVYEPLWRHLSRVHRAGRGRRGRPLPLPRGDRLRRRAGSVRRDHFVHGADRRRREHGHGRARRRPDACRSCSKLDRVDRVAIVFPGPLLAVVDVADLAARFVRRPSTSPAGCSCLDTGATRPREAGCAGARRRPTTRRWCDRAYASTAAEMVGTARRIFDMALAYAKERKQFDVPIGSFQAIQHKLADMSLALERSTAAVHYASMTIDGDDPDRTRRVPRRQGRGRRSGAPDPEGRRSRSTAASATRGSTTCTSTCGARRPTSTCYGTTGWHLDRLADLLIDA